MLIIEMHRFTIVVLHISSSQIAFSISEFDRYLFRPVLPIIDQFIAGCLIVVIVTITSRVFFFVVILIIVLPISLRLQTIVVLEPTQLMYLG